MSDIVIGGAICDSYVRDSYLAAMIILVSDNRNHRCMTVMKQSRV